MVEIQKVIKTVFSVAILFILSVCCMFNVSVNVRRALTQTEVARAVQQLEDGAAQRTVSARLCVGQSVISRLWIRYQRTRSYTRRPVAGRLP